MKNAELQELLHDANRTIQIMNAYTKRLWEHTGHRDTVGYSLEALEDAIVKLALGTTVREKIAKLEKERNKYERQRDLFLSMLRMAVDNEDLT